MDQGRNEIPSCSSNDSTSSALNLLSVRPDVRPLSTRLLFISFLGLHSKPWSPTAQHRPEGIRGSTSVGLLPLTKERAALCWKLEEKAGKEANRAFPAPSVPEAPFQVPFQILCHISKPDTRTQAKHTHH